MNRLVYKKNGQLSYVYATSFCSGNKSLLAMLFNYFFAFNSYVYMEEIEDDKVMFWNKYLEEDYFSFEDVPKLIMSRKNYDELINTWNANISMPKQYLVLSQDDTGWICLEAKDELSELDLISIEQDQKAGQEWEVAWKKRASEHKVKQLLRYWHYELRCLAIKVYKKVREFFEDLFLI